MEGQERPKKGAGHSGYVGDRFNQLGNLPMKLGLGGCEVSRSLHLPAGILKMYMVTLIRFKHKNHPDDITNTLLSPGRILENSGCFGNSGQNEHLKDRRNKEPLIAWVQLEGQQAVTYYL